MKTLQRIQELINSESAKVLSDDARMMSELLWEMLQRIDANMFAVLSDIEVLDHVLRVDVTTDETLIYQNNTDSLVTIKVYNTDPAQTVFVGKNGVAINGPGVPLFHEQSQRFTIASGDAIYGIIELGTVDVRYSVNMIT
jgi:hypothetical protein